MTHLDRFIPPDSYWDPPDDWGETTRDIECPECGHEQKDADVGISGNRREATIYAACEKCEYEWDWTERDD